VHQIIIFTFTYAYPHICLLHSSPRFRMRTSSTTWTTHIPRKPCTYSSASSCACASPTLPPRWTPSRPGRRRSSPRRTALAAGGPEKRTCHRSNPAVRRETRLTSVLMRLSDRLWLPAERSSRCFKSEMGYLFDCARGGLLV
jgi:hypothetical protein